MCCDDSAASVLDNNGKYAEAIPFYIMSGDYVSAGALINNLPLGTYEEQLYAAGMLLANYLYGNGQTWMDIDDSVRNVILGLDQYNDRTGYMAGAINALLGTGPVTWPMPDIDSAVWDSLIADTAGYGSRAAYNYGSNHPVTELQKNAHLFSLYPNPTTGNLSLLTSAKGIFRVNTIDGREIARYSLNSGKTEITLPPNIANGLYMATYVPEDGGKPHIVRFVYQR